MNILIIALNFFLYNPHSLVQNAIAAQTNNNGYDICIQDKRKKRALFEQHFKILDSIVDSNPSDTIYSGNSFQSILFMVKNTKIEVTTDVSGIMGRTKFNKSDWLKWHEWYRKKYGVKK